MRTTTAKRNARNGHVLSTDWMNIRNSFSDTASDVKKIAGSMLDQSTKGIKSQSRRLHNRVSAYTTKKPYQSLGVAILAGLAIGYWLRR